MSSDIDDTNICNCDTINEKINEDKSKEEYYFGGIREYSFQFLEEEILKASPEYIEVFAGSDVRLKKDILSMNNCLFKILQLHGVTFNWRKEEFPQFKLSEQTQIGFIAQEVQKLFPEIVYTNSKTGFLAIEYDKLTSVIVESIKELNQIINSQLSLISNLEQRVKSLETSINGPENGSDCNYSRRSRTRMAELSIN